MLAFLAQSCYNVITGSVWSCSPHWLTISHRPTILACFGAATTRMCEDLSYRKDISMKYTIVFTHNPQDYFEGIEPDELTVYREVDTDELSLLIAPMCADGYNAIVFPENF